MRIHHALTLAIVALGTVGVAAPAHAVHRSAFVGCQPAEGVTRYVLARGADTRIKADKPAEGIYIERRDGSGYWRTLDETERRVVIVSQKPLRAVHGLQVKPGIDGYSRVEDLPKSGGVYTVKQSWRLSDAVLTTECK